MIVFFINIIHLIALKQASDYFMNKVRISKKNTNRISRAFQLPSSPHKQLPQFHRPLKNTLKIEDLRFSNQYSKLSHHQKIIHSNRYKASSFQMNERAGSQGSGDNIAIKKEDTKKPQYLRQFFKKVRGGRQASYRSNDKSPYLQKKFQNKSERKLVISSRHLLQYGRNISKQLKPVRYNSLEEKSQSLEIKKRKGSEEVLKQAKKLMMAGQSRKSILVLKPLLIKEPQNLQALYINGLSLYNIGDYERSTQYLERLIRIKPNYNMNAYFVLAKIQLKVGDLTKCFAKLDQCQQLFPCAVEVLIERAQILMSLHKYKLALSIYQQALKLAPQNIFIKQKLISVYESLQQHQKILQTIEQIKKINQFLPQNKYAVIKCKTLFWLNKFDIIIQEFGDNNDPSLLYYVGYALYTKGDFLKSYLTLQYSLNGSQDCSPSIRLMLLILCRGHDFYEAYHLIQRCQHLNVNTESLTKQFTFVEGCVCLMKRNIYEGVQKLNSIIDQTFPKQNQFLAYAATQLNAYVAYGYFCLGNYECCQKYYKLQKQKYADVPLEGLNYNIDLNRALLFYQDNRIQQSFKLFQHLCEVNQKKLQPHFCLAILYINLYFRYQASEPERVKDHLPKAKELLKFAAQTVSKNHNNTSASVLYHKSVLHGYMKEWKDAIVCLDQAIQKSQQNYWKYFYTRANVLACIHNFTQAINDCTAAINLKQSEPSPYLLRSCCFQIEGEGNCAFRDLQTYISLRPQDKEIHKLAGKLLFQNGAFQDAIAAFNHEPIPQTIANIDVFMTKSKTYFLLGKFTQAGQEMFRVHKINPTQIQCAFDAKMMTLMDKLFSPNVNYVDMISAIDAQYDQIGLQFIKHQIFKKTEKHTLKSICYFYLNKIEQTINELQLAIAMKQKTVMKESLIEGSTREDQKDTRLFIYQMNFNISLCYAIKGNFDLAKEHAEKLTFNSNDIFYQPYRRYMAILYSQTKNSIIGHESQIQHIEVFPSRNKISNFIKSVPILIHESTIYSKLCIPFPKVEPPQIFPNFDQKLLKQFNLEKVERKPEAPWICRQANSIMFTDKIQKYSRLQIQQSITDKSVTSQQIDSSHISLQSIRSRRNKKTVVQILSKVKSNNFQSNKKNMDI